MFRLVPLPIAALACCIALCGLDECLAQEVPPPTAAAPAMREVSPGVFEIGQIRLDQKARRISFPGAVNKTGNDDLLEYLIVTKNGATHESLLVTSVQPTDVHFAMLLLGAKGSGQHDAKPGEVPSGPIDKAYLVGAPKLKGDQITISVKWKTPGGAEKIAMVEDWLFNTKTRQAPERGPWIYNGSLLFESRFLAQEEGNLAAVVTNPSALINNPRKGNDDEELWAVNAKVVPPLETPVEISITLDKPAAETPANTAPPK